MRARPMHLDAEEVLGSRALYAAAHRVCRGKRRKPSVARFLLNLEPNVVAIRDALLDGSWRPATAQPVSIRDPKARLVHVPTVGDRVVHQALGAALEPRIERRLIHDCYASRKGRGTHAAMRRARAWARTYSWFAHLDVQGYFASLDHGVVEAQVHNDVPEPWLCDVILRIVAAHGTPGRFVVPGDDLFTPLSRRVGLPLGTFVSQLLANRYLDPVDHLVKDRLRVRPYLRYMDDMLVFGQSRGEVEDVAKRIEEACWALRLRLHPWEARPTRSGVGFVGYRIHPDQVRVRRSTVARAERRLARLLEELERGERDAESVWRSLRATFAHWDHADTWRLRERFLRRLGLLFPDDEADPAVEILRDRALRAREVKTRNEERG